MQEWFCARAYFIIMAHSREKRVTAPRYNLIWREDYHLQGELPQGHRRGRRGRRAGYRGHIGALVECLGSGGDDGHQAAETRRLDPRQPGSGQISLTPAGRDIANRLLTRHYLIERMLTEVFGMEWYKVHDEAEQLEHAVSSDFERRLLEKLGTNEACPHGNRVEADTPKDRRNLGWKPLDEAPSDREVTVVSVFERDRRLLEYLHGLGIHPGAAVRILGSNYDDTLTLKIEDKAVQLGAGAAAKVWVELAASGAPTPERPASENSRSLPEALLPG